MSGGKVTFERQKIHFQVKSTSPLSKVPLFDYVEGIDIMDMSMLRKLLFSLPAT